MRILKSTFAFSRGFYYVSGLRTSLSFAIWGKSFHEAIILAVIGMWAGYSFILTELSGDAMYYINKSFASLTVIGIVRCFKLILDKIVIGMEFYLSQYENSQF